MPVLPSPADAPRPALYRDGDDRGCADGDRGAPSRLRSREHPVAAAAWRLGPADLAEAARICDDFGYDESTSTSAALERVQNGRFWRLPDARAGAGRRLRRRDEGGRRRSGDGQMPHRRRRSGSGRGAVWVCRSGHRSRRRRADRARAQGLAEGVFARRTIARFRRSTMRSSMRSSGVSRIAVVLNGGIERWSGAGPARPCGRCHDRPRGLSEAGPASGGRSVPVRRACALSAPSSDGASSPISRANWPKAFRCMP